MNKEAWFGDEVLGWRLKCTDQWVGLHRLLEVGLVVGGMHYGNPGDPIFHGEVHAVLQGIAHGQTLRAAILDVPAGAPDELFSFVHRRVYGPMDLSPDEVDRWYKRLMPHYLAPSGLECFDNCEVIAVPVGNKLAVIAGGERPTREYVQPVTSAVEVPQGRLESLTMEAVAWIDAVVGLPPQ